jgi:hypothetical protein
MFLAEHLELDLENRGNQVIGWIGAVLNFPVVTYPSIRLQFPRCRKSKKENGNETDSAD